MLSKRNLRKFFQRKALCCANKCSSKILHCLQQIKTMEKRFVKFFGFLLSCTKILVVIRIKDARSDVRSYLDRNDGIISK